MYFANSSSSHPCLTVICLGQVHQRFVSSTSKQVRHFMSVSYPISCSVFLHLPELSLRRFSVFHLFHFQSAPMGMVPLGLFDSPLISVSFHFLKRKVSFVVCSYLVSSFKNLLVDLRRSAGGYSSNR